MVEITGSASITVGDLHTAVAVGSGDLPVLATPWLIALLEGATVEASARVASDDGRRLEFEVEGRSADRIVGRGTIQRVGVDRARFLGALS